MELHLTTTGCHLPYRITCHPTQVNTEVVTEHLNTPSLTPAQPARPYSIYLPRWDRRLSGPIEWLVTYQDGLPVNRRSPIQVACSAWPGVELATCWYVYC